MLHLERSRGLAYGPSTEIESSRYQASNTILVMAWDLLPSIGGYLDLQSRVMTGGSCHGGDLACSLACLI